MIECTLGSQNGQEITTAYCVKNRENTQKYTIYGIYLYNIVPFC